MLLEQLRKSCREHPPTVIFAEANHEAVIKAARELSDRQLAIPILFGGAFEIREIASQINIATKGLKIINPNHQHETEPYVKQLIQHKKISRPEAGRIIKDPILQSLLRLASGRVDIAFAGNGSSVAHVISTALSWSGIHKSYQRVSSFYLMISPDQRNIFAFADCSINISPNATQLAEIGLKTAMQYQLLTGRKPEIAFLSFSTKGSAKHNKVDPVQEAVEIFKGKKSGFNCDGELQFDAAIDHLIAEKKAPNGSLNGNANVFIFPSLNAANIAQKIAAHICGYMAFGPIVIGLKESLHLLPKSCTSEEIINSVLLASLLKIKNV